MEKLKTYNLKAYSLSSLGIDGVAFEKEDAIKVVEYMRDECIPISGGDVFRVVDDSIEVTYDNWNCDRNHQESMRDYLYRSCDKAIEYITNYPVESKAEEIYIFQISATVLATIE